MRSRAVCGRMRGVVVRRSPSISVALTDALESFLSSSPATTVARAWGDGYSVNDQPETNHLADFEVVVGTHGLIPWLFADMSSWVYY